MNTMAGGERSEKTNKEGRYEAVRVSVWSERVSRMIRKGGAGECSLTLALFHKAILLIFCK